MYTYTESFVSRHNVFYFQSQKKQTFMRSLFQFSLLLPVASLNYDSWCYTLNHVAPVTHNPQFKAQLQKLLE